MQKRAQSPALANGTGSREIPGWVVIASPEILGQEPSSGQRVLTNTPTTGGPSLRLPPSTFVNSLNSRRRLFFLSLFLPLAPLPGPALSRPVRAPTPLLLFPSLPSTVDQNVPHSAPLDAPRRAGSPADDARLRATTPGLDDADAVPGARGKEVQGLVEGHGSALGSCRRRRLLLQHQPHLCRRAAGCVSLSLARSCAAPRQSALTHTSQPK